MTENEMYMDIDEILAENTRRSAAGSDFDPVSGRGSIGERFEVKAAGLTPARQWWPKTMQTHPLAVKLLSGGSITADEHQRLHRLRLLHDFAYWCATCVKIKRKGGGDDIFFRLNAPQRRLVECFEQMRLRDKPIRLILLKARQWGGSTCVQMYMAWLQLVHRRGMNSLILAHQGAGSDEIKDMYDRMLMHYDPALMFDADDPRSAAVQCVATDEWADDSKQYTLHGKPLKVTRKVGNSGAITGVLPRNCKIKISSAERPDACRGADLSLVHLSEVGIWRKTDGKDPQDIVRAACSGILYRPMSMIVLESTANGTGNYFHNEYLAAKSHESQFEALFISWFEIEQYRLNFADDAERRSFAERLVGKRTDSTVCGRAQSGVYMWRLWQSGATLEALHWYEVERRKYPDHALMAAEYPSDDVEAFAHSGVRVFELAGVERLRRDVRDPAAVGELTAAGHDGIDSLRDIQWRDDSTGGLSVWAQPERGVYADRYLCVVDVGGRALRSDWSVAVVIDRAPLRDGGRPEVVAQWRGHVDHDRLAVIASRLAAWYDNALLVIESNTLDTRDAQRLDDGDMLPFLTRKLRDVYPNLYARAQSDTDIIEGRPVRYGFHTNVSTKPMIIHNLVQSVREGLYVERDVEAINEYTKYEQRPNGSYGAIAGCHDDILMTRAIALFISQHEMLTPALRASAAPRRRRTTSW